MSEAEEKIGYVFRDKMLLRQAFTHSSYINEHEAESNERLEFLGDSILGFVIAYELFTDYVGYNEGHLSDMRSQIVSEVPLSKAILESGLNKKMLFSVGERSNEDNSSICGDLFEAIVGAIYLDGGMEKAKSFILRFLRNTVKNAKPQQKPAQEKNHKGELCEYIQTRHLVATYTLLKESGEKHKPVFEVKCALSDGTCSNGTGFSKKAAEQSAAMAVLKKIDKKNKSIEKSANRPAKKNTTVEFLGKAKSKPQEATNKNKQPEVANLSSNKNAKPDVLNKNGQKNKKPKAVNKTEKDIKEIVKTKNQKGRDMGKLSKIPEEA